MREGVLISALSEEIFTLLDELHLQWCPWPDKGCTLAVLAHRQIGVLTDHLLVQRLLLAEASTRKTPAPGEELQ
jgi:hypothetical protein